jgi:hypothetical protein
LLSPDEPVTARRKRCVLGRMRGIWNAPPRHGLRITRWQAGQSRIAYIIRKMRLGPSVDNAPLAAVTTVRATCPFASARVPERRRSKITRLLRVAQAGRLCRHEYLPEG